jgi:hypothetical protein
MLSLLKMQGVTAVLEDSSGNGGASVSCYAAAGGLEAVVNPSLGLLGPRNCFWGPRKLLYTTATYKVFHETRPR